jgi:hypothetical protein
MNTNNSKNETNAGTKQKQRKTKLSNVRLFTFKREFIKELSVDLQAALAAERQLSKEEYLEKELNMVNFCLLRV